MRKHTFNNINEIILDVDEIEIWYRLKCVRLLCRFYMFLPFQNEHNRNEIEFMRSPIRNFMSENQFIGHWHIDYSTFGFNWRLKTRLFAKVDRFILRHSVIRSIIIVTNIWLHLFSSRTSKSVIFDDDIWSSIRNIHVQFTFIGLLICDVRFLTRSILWCHFRETMFKIAIIALDSYCNETLIGTNPVLSAHLCNLKRWFEAAATTIASWLFLLILSSIIVEIAVVYCVSPNLSAIYFHLLSVKTCHKNRITL